MFKTCEHIIISFRTRETDGKREQMYRKNERKEQNGKYKIDA